MAKWGEGDPRWIVEERPDATNVNNWHWTEKNATPWSKERLHQLFQDFKIERNDIDCIVEGVDKCSGEATVNNRKGKLIFFYEWELVLKWSGCLLKNSKLSHKGKLTIPNLSEENDLDDVEITVTIDESNDESETLKQFMYNVGRDSIRKQLGVYIKELKEEYSKNLILPKKGAENNGPALADTQLRDANNAKNAAQKAATAAGGGTNSQTTTKTSNSGTNVGCKLDVRSLSMAEEFHCNANDLYNALTKPDMVTAFTRAPAKVDAVRGGEFVLYGGNVLGKFEELVPEKKIQQSWRLKNWASGHYSNVTIELEETSSSTMMTLKQTGIPASEYEAMRTNWHRYYWHSIKQTFGFGTSIADAL
ncbi:activator of 90 kDa heat shock protein ATPase homolog 1 [Scaptodrosophila lebanonensis]|uniref:Activator of 90 kDa heat shock protein ATPase homolog 1 n=1 Tax=Drosophila lebanonensis TaxID=7225 RepID=A0A6J2TMZ1_DROLE|nr:activator of 90 kDa heat shock protein ATPase homolog 1 [Scaptodrosophila lebanonensis]